PPGAAVSPVNQAPHVFRCSLEDGLDPAVGQVAHPAADVVLLGHLAARVTEENTLDASGDEYPVADHGTDAIVTARRRRASVAGAKKVHIGWQGPISGAVLAGKPTGNGPRHGGPSG